MLSYQLIHIDFPQKCVVLLHVQYFHLLQACKLILLVAPSRASVRQGAEKLGMLDPVLKLKCKESLSLG